MHVYIPVVPILWVLLWYGFVGIALYGPLMTWQNRFISGNRSAWDGMRPRLVLRGILASMVAWPIILGYNIKTEIHYRKKGYL